MKDRQHRLTGKQFYEVLRRLYPLKEATMSQTKLLCAALIAAVLATPYVAAATPEAPGGSERRKETLGGKWYSNGDRDKPVQIFSTRKGLQAKNENGQTSRLE